MWRTLERAWLRKTYDNWQDKPRNWQAPWYAFRAPRTSLFLSTTLNARMVLAPFPPLSPLSCSALPSWTSPHSTARKVCGDSRTMRLPKWVCEGPRRETFCRPTMLSAAYYRAQGQRAATTWHRVKGGRTQNLPDYALSQHSNTPPHYPHYQKGCKTWKIGFRSGMRDLTVAFSTLGCADPTGRQVFQRRCHTMWE